MKRHVIEGTWPGYSSSQDRVCHRKITTGPKFIAWAKSVYGITFTDGTLLRLDARECKPREKVKEIDGYSSLIDDCFYYGVTSVAALVEARKAAKP